MKLAYISGPITGRPEKIYVPAFAKAKEKLKQAGYEPVNPLELPHLHDKTWSSYIGEDIKELLECNAIYMLPDWKESKGARIEHAIACELGLEIIYSTEWKESHTVAKVVQDVKGFSTLAEAKALNNSEITNHAWVYDRFKNVAPPSEQLTSENMTKMFEEMEAQLPSEDELPEDYLFRLVPVDTFDSGEQIQFLIEKGKFYYAQEK
jgi:hypothetical protein